jgi:hypothetical protein
MRFEERKRKDRLDQRGVALPLALFGLVAVSVLVTSALLTSSTELALSQAHQDGARALYAADAALEEFVAQRAGMVANPELRLANGAYPLTVSGAAYSVGVAELHRTAPAPLPNGGFERRETYSLVAQPQSGRGRGVGAMIEAIRTATGISLNIDSGLTVGTNTTIAGSATISDGSSAGAACDSASAPAAIRHAEGTSITQKGNGHDIFGSIVKDDRGAAELMEYVLNGSTIEDLTDLAHIRFGPMFSRPLFSNANGPAHDAANPDYRWGCPPQLISGCSPEQATYFPTVVIDGNGSIIDITGAHGQGILVVRNGDINIRGNFQYAGIIIVEGTLRVTGTPRLEGAVIAMGDEAVIEPSDDTLASGNSLVRFNKCQIVEAQKGLTISSLNSSPQTIATPTYAWYEVVR